MEVLHTYHNGAQLCRTTIATILAIPVWKGNRILDHEHVKRIRDSLEADGTSIKALDSGFHIVRYEEADAGGHLTTVQALVDGQHRYEVIRQLREPCQDFPVTCIVKPVASEIEAIEYFNTINQAKPLQYTEDPVLIVNRFVAAIQGAFPSKKKLIRTLKTRRPYLSVEDLREALERHVGVLRRWKPDRFVAQMLEANGRIVTELQLELSLSAKIRDKSVKETATEIGFGLAIYPGLPWIAKILAPSE